MKILVLSDSHRNVEILTEVLGAVSKDISCVFFLGDCYEDIMPAKDIHAHIVFYAVRGNCDFGFGNPDEGFVTISGANILFCHGHKYGVKHSLDRLLEAGIDREADVCLYGHTHCPEIMRKNGVLLFNPGSISFPKHSPNPSYGILTIENGLISASVIERYDIGKFRLLYSESYTHPEG